MLNWLSRIPGWAWLIVIFMILCTVRIEAQLRTLIELLEELRDHFLPDDEV
jgi:hypothetical protein